MLLSFPLGKPAVDTLSDMTFSPRRPRLHAQTVLPLLATAALSSCMGSVEAMPVSLRDPLGLLDDADEVRLYLMPGETHVCDGTRGVVAPMVPDVPVGTTPGAVADLILTPSGGRAMQELSVPPGTYVALVRAKGTDPVSGVRNTFTATGCAEVIDLESNDTRSVAITLNPIVTPGVCSDGRLSPDEQCTTPGVGDCNASCQTTPYRLNTTLTDDAQALPRIAARGTNHPILSFTTDPLEAGVRLLEPTGLPISMSTSAILAEDATLTTILQRPEPPFPRLDSTTDTATAIAANGRIGFVATTVMRSPNLDLRVGFFSDRLVPEQAFVSPRASDDNAQQSPSAAFNAAGAFLVAFVDAGTPSGIYTRAFAAASAMPLGADATIAAEGGDKPALVGRADDFVLAYQRGGLVYYRLVSATGVAGEEVAVADMLGAQSAPSVAALSDGGFVIAWAEANGDESGSAVRGRVFAADGTPRDAFLANSTEAGSQSAPIVAAHADRIAITFTSDASIRARFFTITGEPALNRESLPSTTDFVVAVAGDSPTVAATGAGETAMWLFVYRTLGDGAGDITARRLPR